MDRPKTTTATAPRTNKQPKGRNLGDTKNTTVPDEDCKKDQQGDVTGTSRVHCLSISYLKRRKCECIRVLVKL